MATGKRYYWIKLKDSFMNSERRGVDRTLGLLVRVHFLVALLGLGCHAVTFLPNDRTPLLISMSLRQP